MFELIAKLIQIVPLIKQVYDIIRQIGAVLFPTLSPDEQFQAAQTILDPVGVKKIQEKLNKLGADPKLVVDGIYGEATKAAAKVVQKKFGLEEDGWVGRLTEAVIDAEIAKLPA